MLATDMFRWWYGYGWSSLVAWCRGGYHLILRSFSFELLFRTLFSPWRRIISYPGASLEDKLRALADNVFSRIIGFFIRFFVIIAAAICLLLWTICCGLMIVLWPLVPPAIPASLVMGVVTL